MMLVPSDAHPRLLRLLVLGILLLGTGYVAELIGKSTFPPLRAVGVILGVVGIAVFLVAGVLYLGYYLSDMLSDLFG